MFVSALFHHSKRTVGNFTIRWKQYKACVFISKVYDESGHAIHFRANMILNINTTQIIKSGTIFEFIRAQFKAYFGA